MANKIIIPSAGQITDDFKIIKLFIQIGQEIKEWEIVAEIETYKSTLELESFCSGKISKILVKEGDMVETGQTIAIVKWFYPRKTLKSNEPIYNRFGFWNKFMQMHYYWY